MANQCLLIAPVPNQFDDYILGYTASPDHNEEIYGTSHFYNSGAHKFVIPIIALPDDDDDDNLPNYHRTRICVIPPTPLPEGYDPFDI